MSDPYASYTRSLGAPAERLVLLSEDDATELETPKFLYVTTAGNANITDLAGNDLDNFPLTVGYHPLRILKLRTGGSGAVVYACYDKQ